MPSSNRLLNIYTVAGIHSFNPVLYFTFIHNHAMFGQTGPPNSCHCFHTPIIAPLQPVNLVQNDAANTESSVVVLWEAPEETGGSGVYISETGGASYTVTVDVDGRIMSQNVTCDVFNGVQH